MGAERRMCAIMHVMSRNSSISGFTLVFVPPGFGGTTMRWEASCFHFFSRRARQELSLIQAPHIQLWVSRGLSCPCLAQGRRASGIRLMKAYPLS